MNTKSKAKTAAKRLPKKRSTVGASIITGLEQAIAWSRGENHNVRVTLVHVPNVDVRDARTKMGPSQAQFATKFRRPHCGIGSRDALALTPHASSTGGDRQAPGGRRGRARKGGLGLG
jgi:hypothetical protein